MWGSSPLTRGKRRPEGRGRVRRGLIPAHAGKTHHPDRVGDERWAHPRSRGENERPGDGHQVRTGSSPLTRGKPNKDEGIRLGYGLIPAHAGKTSDCMAWVRSGRAHPRSRGENFSRPNVTPLLPGSSPLTRGKRLRVPGSRTAGGLIPAHAGKTTAEGLLREYGGAHPRSRGENAKALGTCAR